MRFAGIDVGSLTAEAIVVQNGKILGSAQISVRPNPVDSAREVFDAALKKAGMSENGIGYAVSTGYGREKIQEAGLANENVSEISCHGFGAYSLDSDVRTIIDIGGQDAKVIRINEGGELADFVMNDKCAAGTGHFLEIMSKALGVSLDEIGPLAQSSRRPVEMTNRCSIYVETEVIHFLQRGLPKQDLAAGINRAMAERVFALARRIGPKDKIMMTGGVAKNIAVRTDLETMLKARIQLPKIDPQLIGAYGAAMLAQQKGASL
jgi:predicted CoA-substrate-specific enzyme activase